MKMPNALNYRRCDEIAECWDGLSQGAYMELWGFVMEQKPLPLEYPPEPDFENAARFWPRFSLQLKCEIIAADARQQREWEEIRSRLGDTP